jgi:hypothetical protein
MEAAPTRTKGPLKNTHERYIQPRLDDIQIAMPELGNLIIIGGQQC